MQSISVSQLNQAIAAILDETVGTVSVVGEISNFTRARSGHRYFTLKDDGAQVSCTLWRGRSLSFLPSDGMKVVVTGDVTVYSPRGQYQIDCVRVEPLGQGELYLAFEALKEELAANGYFDADRKRPLPVLPLKVGVVTSATGAAVRDIFSTLERRMPACEVTLVAAAVQGERAPAEVAAAIATLNRETSCDVAIVGRGGGSLEDLWAFNTVEVANAILDSEIPVISAVGHETDFTIADFVADARAATPTAAAELASPQPAANVLAWLDNRQQLMGDRIQDRLQELRQRLESQRDSYGFRTVGDRLRAAQQQVDELESKLSGLVQQQLKDRSQVLELLSTQLKALRPLAPLDRGFAIVKRDGQALAGEDVLEEGDRVEIVLSQQTARATIDEICRSSPQDFA
ncbi:MAG: exodeoxyribonuclease VII large subunit [Cyanobacteria bacterium P01_E01_bin.45]